jgi:hypothetical protein
MRRIVLSLLVVLASALTAEAQCTGSSCFVPMPVMAPAILPVQAPVLVQPMAPVITYRWGLFGRRIVPRIRWVPVVQHRQGYE